MTEALDNGTPTRRLRADARRSIDAILTAARAVLNKQPGASMEDIAAAAGVTRQTVYAHFPSRDALVTALLDATAAEIIAALDAARLDTAPPADALRQFFGICWQMARDYPLVLDPAINRISPAAGDTVHRATTVRLERLIRRGQHDGDFDRTLATAWLTAAVLGLTHTAIEQVAAGRLTTSQAAPMLVESALRLCGGAPDR